MKSIILTLAALFCVTTAVSANEPKEEVEEVVVAEEASDAAADKH